MADYRLTRKAEEDLRDCFRYGVENFGLETLYGYDPIYFYPRHSRGIENLLGTSEIMNTPLF